ncbi:MAG TPA: M20/M25/M40 family metallo-hydrolase [Sphingomicrobium sp.]|nr:M20/M25/M40 family metallo-hydrolase [Sphingomicrobium sp.]
MHLNRFLLPLAALLLGATTVPADEGAAERIRSHVAFLADDRLEGRDTGSVGFAIAADYVAGELAALGLRPGGVNGSWYQPVRFRRGVQAAPPTITYTVRGRRTQLAAGQDAGVRPSLAQRQRIIDAPLLFVGHGISDAQAGFDDYAGLDARGKIVVALGGSPGGQPSDVAAHLQQVKAETAAARGAVGFIEIDTNGRYRSSAVTRAGRPVTGWLGPNGPGGHVAADIGALIALSSEWAERVFEGASRPLAAVKAEAARGPVRGFDLPGRIRIEATTQWQEFASPQVIGLIPGSDPALSTEHVVLMGHLDHLGIDASARPGANAVYNGALDNAAGVATLIEAARTFIRSGQRPRRSIMIIAVTGEERGLLGADYFAANPTVPLSSIVGLVNLDMPVLLYDFTDVIAFGGEHSTMTSAVAEAARAMGVQVSPDPMPEQTLFVRSDHYRFVQRGVPSVFLMTGHDNGGKVAWDHFLANVYHTPRDDLSQPIDWRAGAKFAELNYRIARTLADQPQRPLWYRDSYFGRAFAPSQPKAER